MLALNYISYLLLFFCQQKVFLTSLVISGSLHSPKTTYTLK